MQYDCHLSYLTKRRAEDAFVDPMVFIDCDKCRLYLKSKFHYMDWDENLKDIPIEESVELVWQVVDCFAISVHIAVVGLYTRNTWYISLCYPLLSFSFPRDPENPFDFSINVPDN